MSCSEADSGCLDCLTRRTAEWSALSESQLAELDKAKVTRTFEPGHVIFHQGEEFSGLYCIQSGLIGMRRVDEDGNSALLRLSQGGETIGYRALFDKREHRNTAEALATSVVCHIQGPTILRLLEQNPALGSRFLTHCLQDMTRTESDYVRTLTKKMKSRLLYVLMIFYEQIGSRDDDNNHILDLPIQRQQLADLLGATPESVSRLIRRLEGEGLVRVRDRRVTISSMDDVVAEIGPLH